MMNWVDKALQKDTAQVLGVIVILSGGWQIWLSGRLLDLNGRRRSRLLGYALGLCGVLLFGTGLTLISVYVSQLSWW